MKFENLKHGSLFKREFYLKDVKIDLKNDFFVYSIITNEKTLEIFLNQRKKIYKICKLFFMIISCYTQNHIVKILIN
ncbi:hypothetical protein RZU89_08435 [Campylobacter coli]